MKVILHVRNFGKIEKADIELSNFVLFVGNNNSGKTYLMQFIYGLLRYIDSKDFDVELTNDSNQDVINDLNINKYIEVLNKNIADNIHEIILSTFKNRIAIGSIWFEVEMEDSYIEVQYINNEVDFTRFIIRDNHFDYDVIKKDDADKSLLVIGCKLFTDNVEKNSILWSVPSRFLKQYTIKSVYYLIFSSIRGMKARYFPSSRAGLHMLYKEYFLSSGDNIFRNERYEANDDHSSLTTPMYEFIRFLQSYHYNGKRAEKNKYLIDFFETHLIDGKLQKTDNVYYQSFNQNEPLPLYVTSAMVSELAPFYYYITSSDFDDRGYLMIDEAESSLHPKKQFELVRFITRLNNNGTRIIMSTHSDSMASKINNLALLSHKMKQGNISDEKLNKIGLNKDDFLNDIDLKVYSFSNKGTYSVVSELEYDENIGFTFDGFEDALDILLAESKTILG